MELQSHSKSVHERGMAHVSIFWMLVPMVLMIAALVFAYDRHTSLLEGQETTKAAKADKAEAELMVKAHKALLEQITAKIGNEGVFTFETPDRDEDVKISGYTTPTELATKIATTSSVFATAKSADTMNQLIEAMKTKRDELAGRISQLEADLTTAREQKTAAEERLASVTREKDGEIDRLNSEKLAEQRKVERTVENYENQLASAQEQTRRAQDARRRAEQEAQDKVKGMQKEIDIRDVRLQIAQDKLRILDGPQGPDGEILASSERTGLAWINRGARDMIKKGLTFRVLERTKDGYKFKSNAVVTRVEDDRSEVRILNLVDRLNPVVQGDVIANDLYTPELKRNILLVGRFVTPLTKSEIRSKLEAMGNTVFDKFSPSVDLVIVGREQLGEEAVKIQDMPDYQMAQKLSVEIVPLQRIRDFLRL
jgi:hypothetical protein